jgi:hypothetical protein
MCKLIVSGLPLLLAALSLASCDASTEESELTVEELCASRSTEESCRGAVPDGYPFNRCVWMQWNEVQVDPATGATTLVPATPTCEFGGGDETGCQPDTAELSCAPSDQHRPVAKTTDIGVLVAFSDQICDRVLPPMTFCEGDENNLEPSECAALCGG